MKKSRAAVLMVADGIIAVFAAMFYLAPHDVIPFLLGKERCMHVAVVFCIASAVLVVLAVKWAFRPLTSYGKMMIIFQPMSLAALIIFTAIQSRYFGIFPCPRYLEPFAMLSLTLHLGLCVQGVNFLLNRFQ
mgnify:FL=1